MQSNLRLTPEAAQRLGVYAAMTRRHAGDIVSELILSHLKRYRVQDMEPGGGAGEGPAPGEGKG